MHAKDTDMLPRVYNVKKISSFAGDWVKLLDSDKEMFDINFSDEELLSLSQDKLKDHVKKRAVQLTLVYIEGLKEKHSKTQKYDTSTLSTSEYLTDDRFVKSELDLLFKLRSRTIQVKQNFTHANLSNMICEMCKLFTCTQEHVIVYR